MTSDTERDSRHNKDSNQSSSEEENEVPIKYKKVKFRIPDSPPLLSHKTNREDYANREDSIKRKTFFTDNFPIVKRKQMSAIQDYRNIQRLEEPSNNFSNRKTRHTDMGDTSRHESDDTDKESEQIHLSSASTLTMSSDSATSFSTHFMNIVLKNQAAMNYDLKVIKTLLESFKNISEYKHVNVEEESIFLNKLPCSTINDLEEIELEIAGDKNKFDELVAVLYLTGREQVQKTVYAILKKLLMNQVAVKFSGQGRKSKMPFNELTVNKAVICATRKRHKNATDTEIKKTVGLYLAQAKARMNLHRTNDEL
ncbi:hypothetical protein Zmor_003646 [Zophobas morio]|uniref:DUF4806 domain-containing protein n=1 Tax=Zophobas morio TaxID=2755281 RepID=A0AA38M1U8_9CUCU|nr:hypothetical protein Zmor_003646 [Zophobas morio]